MSDLDNYLYRNFHGDDTYEEVPSMTDRPGTYTSPAGDTYPARYISRGLAPDAKKTATELYGAAEAERLFPAPIALTIQATVIVDVDKMPTNDKERDTVYRAAVTKIVTDTAELNGEVGYSIVKINGEPPTHCQCPACTWYETEFSDNVHGLSCSNGDGVIRICDHDGCTCPAGLMDGECEACWLWSK